MAEPEPLGIGARIRDLRERTDVPRATLADLLGVNEHKIARVEEDPSEECGLTLKQLRACATVLAVDISYLVVGAISAWDERTRQSNDNLKVLAREEGMSFDDFELLWDGFIQRQRDAIGYVAAARSTQIVSKEQWRAWYRKMLEKRGGLELF